MSSNRTLSRVVNQFRRKYRLNTADVQDLRQHLHMRLLEMDVTALNEKQVFVALRNDAMSWLRHYVRHANVTHLEALEETGFEPAAKDVNPDTNILIDQCLGQLTPNQRRVMEMYFGLLDAEPTTSFAVIAARVNVSPTVARRLYSAALSRLRIFAKVQPPSLASCCRN